MANFKIALTAGHYKYTAGKRIPKALDPNETREWELNNRIADKVEQLLSDYIGYELLRLDDTTGEKNISLTARTNAANAWGATEYYSIHHNAGIKGGSGGGIVVYAYTKASAASLEMQKALYDALINATGLKGNRKTPLAKANLHEVRETNMPAVLMELGFMDSAADAPIILTEEYADKCAGAIVEVMVKRGGLKKKVAVPDPVPTENTVTLVLPVLKRGDKGEQVKALQALLIGYGYSCGDSGVDGSFGPATENALKACQDANGWKVDGKAGPEVWNGLMGLT